MDIQEHQVSSSQQYWTTAALGRLPRAHAGVADRDSASPIVLVEYEGTLRLIDGNHRINRWVADTDVQKHQVNMHSVAGVGQFVELPRVPVRPPSDP